MDVQMDTSFESWGGFWQPGENPRIVQGRLLYDPTTGIALDLTEAPSGMPPLGSEAQAQYSVLFGHLVNGTLVTLTRAFVTESTFGGGIGCPTKLIASRALFGAHVTDLDQLLVKSYSMRLTSLENWMCACPVQWKRASEGEKHVGVDMTYRFPQPIAVSLPKMGFDIEIGHTLTTRPGHSSFNLDGKAYFKVVGHAPLTMARAHEIAWQCQNLMSLLVGREVSVRSVEVTPLPADTTEMATSSCQILYHRIERAGREHLQAALMLMPYATIKDDFPRMVERWLDRSEQSVLATNVYFGSLHHQSPAVNVKFLAIVHAIESYHRSLGVGLYMDQGKFDKAIESLLSHIPPEIQGDHRLSLKSRLKYGNEYSLRRRLVGMLDRIPENARLRIAGDVAKFVQRVVATRNYYTHYDCLSKEESFSPKETYTAAERLRILLVANLIHDLGVKDADLMSILERSQDFQHWLRQPLLL
jgi:hypothetical protein